MRGLPEELCWRESISSVHEATGKLALLCVRLDLIHRSSSSIVFTDHLQGCMQVFICLSTPQSRTMDCHHVVQHIRISAVNPIWVCLFLHLQYWWYGQPNVEDQGLHHLQAAIVERRRQLLEIKLDDVEAVSFSLHIIKYWYLILCSKNWICMTTFCACLPASIVTCMARDIIRLLIFQLTQIFVWWWGNGLQLGVLLGI